MSNELNNPAPDGARSNTRERDYEVGYGKPPKATQFKKGQSGNPKGRKKAQSIEDLRVVLEDSLDEPIEVRQGGRVQTTTKLEAMFQAQLSDALKGKPKAVRRLFELGRKTGMFTEAPRQGLLQITEPTGERGRIIRMFNAEQEARKQQTNKATDMTASPGDDG